MICSGLYTALITPFDSRGELDEEGLDRNLDHQVKGGVDGLVVLGTTGEAPTLTLQEKERIVTRARHSKLPLIVGCGTNSTTSTLETLCWAEALGADIAMVVNPYYNKPTQEGLYRHFSSLSDRSPLPLLLYNIPGRTGVNLAPKTVERLLAHTQIIGIKEAAADMVQLSELISFKAKYPNFSVLAGDDGWTLSTLALGGDGVVSVASNLYPKEMQQLIASCKKEDYRNAAEIHHRLLPFFKACFVETNPIPIKAAMEQCGFAAGSPRPPLTSFAGELQSLMESLL